MASSTPATKMPSGSSKPARPSLNPISTGGPRALHLPALSTAPLSSISNIPSPSSSVSPPASAFSATGPRRKQPGRRQTSISYLPHDSPRSWTLGRSASVSSPLSACAFGKKRGAKEISVPGRPPGSEPAVLTLAEKHADLLQFIAQKESKCLDLRSQLALQESELRDLKQKWERIVHREFGRVLAPSSASLPSSAMAPSKPAAKSAQAAAAPILGGPTTTAVVGGIVGGMRMLAAAASTLTPDASPAPSLAARPSPFAKRAARQSASVSTSSTSASISIATPRTSSTSSFTSSPEVASYPEDAPREREELMVRDTGATPTFSPNPAFVPSTSAKALRRRSRDDPSKRAPASPDPPPSASKRDSGRGFPPASSVPGMGSMGVPAMQGWVDSVGSRWADLQRVPTFAKSQKRASVLFADVSQSIFAALAPVSPATQKHGSLLDDDDDMPEGGEGKGLGEVLTPDVPPAAPSGHAQQDDDDDEWNW